MTSALSLYIHWPFCKSKCPYCDFNSYVKQAIDEADWLNSALKEMQSWAEKIGPRSLTTIFVGGGTPSLMTPQSMQALLDEASRLWTFADDIEISMEANPTSSDTEKFRDFRAAGINRLSLGVQSLIDADLKFLGREHNADQAIKAVEDAAKIFPRFSFDLIYARKNQTAKSWEAELKQALKLAPNHLSLYQLTLEPGTAFTAKAERGDVFQASLDAQIEMYDLTQNIMNDAGLPAYEISNHAKHGHECRHNLAYWHYDEYLGIGPGAHGRIALPYDDAPRFAQQNLRKPEAWHNAVIEHGVGAEILTPLAFSDAQTEALLMGLRLAEGINKTRWQKLFSSSLDDFLNQKKKAALLDAGFVSENSDYFFVTSEGRLKLSAITEALVN